MKTNFIIDNNDIDHWINVIAMEAYNLEQVVSEKITLLKEIKPNPTSLLRHWNIGLESNDQEIDEKKKSILEKVWDFIIGMLKKIYNAVVQFISNIDITGEKEKAKKAEEVVKKHKASVNFSTDVISKLSPAALAVIHAIEKEKEFIPQYNTNIYTDSKIVFSSSMPNEREITKNEELVKELEEGIVKLNGFITTAESKPENERNYPLIKTLDSGVSINGSENGAYLKVFEKNSASKKKYEQLTELAEKFKSRGASEEVVEVMKKIAISLSKQFSLEARVVKTYLNLNEAIIQVNNKTYEDLK